jgi:methyltransferase family protein
VGTCCSPDPYRKLFGRKQARKDAKRFRRKGLDATARRLVDGLAERDVDGAEVLEVGGGVGGVDIELLRAGAARATIVELSPEYDEEAAALLREAGLEGRIERRIGDFVADGVPPADVVVMHRVVCCYPDEEALVGAAADHARRLLALSFPRNALHLRPIAWAMDQGLRIVFHFRFYVRPREQVLAPAQARGFRVVSEHEGVFWRIAVLERGQLSGSEPGAVSQVKASA